ncbi:SCO2583/SCO2584 N-terminal domain-containing protein, partial [Streptomyces sp. NPDC001226]
VFDEAFVRAAVVHEPTAVESGPSRCRVRRVAATSASDRWGSSERVQMVGTSYAAITRAVRPGSAVRSASATAAARCSWASTRLVPPVTAAARATVLMERSRV